MEEKLDYAGMDRASGQDMTMIVHPLIQPIMPSPKEINAIAALVNRAEMAGRLGNYAVGARTAVLMQDFFARRITAAEVLDDLKTWP